MIQGLPAVRPAVVHVAVPELMTCPAQPAIVTPACLKSTVPVAAAGLTVAVYVTASPAVEGSNEDASVIVALVVPVLSTTCFDEDDAEVR